MSTTTTTDTAASGWPELRTRAARLGIVLLRTDPADGAVRYISVAGGTCRQHADLPALRRWLDDMEGLAE